VKKQPFSVLFLLLALLLLFTILAVTSMPAVTYDEPNYVTAGYSYYKTRDYRLNFEHPPFAKLIAGFPLLFINPEIDFTSEAWTTATTPEAAYVMQWYFSKEFFYYSNNDPDQLLFYSRIPFILLGILLGIYVFRWATLLYGNKAGILALFFYSLSPNILAYTQLAITDVALTTFFFITLYYFWRWQETKTTADFMFCSVFLGLSLATKLTSVYLLAILALLMILRRDKKEIITDGTYLIGMIIIASMILSATYLFIHTPQYIEAI
jgi:predicted membrane-bound dolichyl-phosphate-mannose-protein mannosyltransferase